LQEWSANESVVIPNQEEGNEEASIQ
jgi:hypothetical protein